MKRSWFSKNTSSAQIRRRRTRQAGFQGAWERLEDRYLLTGVITQANYFDTWDGGEILSTDVAGITFEGGNLFLADSEINELGPPIFDGDNIFEVTTDGASTVQEYTSNNTEPTGITYNEFDEFFYVTNDNTKLITRYDSFLDTPLASVSTSAVVPSATDPEGITSDPAGFLYVADGKSGGRQILVYDSTLAFQYSFSVSGQIDDPEGIAFHPDTNHLFIVSGTGSGDFVYEYTLNGVFVEEYDLSQLTPAPISPQGATFAPTSNTGDPPDTLALYLADAGIDNSPDGGVYETLVAGAQLAQNTAPLVNASADQNAKVSGFPAVMNLNAAVADDGLPIPSAVTTTWTQVSGPATASFGDDSAIDTTVTLPTAGTYVLRLTANDTEFVVSDEVTIDVSVGVEVQVAANSDDAEEPQSGNIQLNSNDLDLGGKAVGLRFAGVNIPKGSTITNAYIQFQADETDSAATPLTIEGHDIDDAPTFTNATNNITSRDRTNTSVAWSPPAWTVRDAGADQQTPDIASIIQDIVDLSGWSSGNALAIIITGSGDRAAESHNASAAFAPTLFVDFDLPPAVTIEDVTEVEGTGLQFSVTLDKATAAPFDVNVSLADMSATGGAPPLVSPEDYDNTAVVLNFAGTAGEMQQFTVATLVDPLIEGSETFTVNLSATDPLVDDNDTAVGQIDDGDSAAVTVEDVTELEGVGLQFTVMLDKATAAPFDVNVSLADITATGGAPPLVTPEDYDNTAVVLNFAGDAGEMQQFTVATLDDAVLEASETFTVNLSATDPLLDDSDTAIGTIDDSDSAAVTVEDITELEGTGFLFTVTLDNAVQGGTNVSVTLADVSATGGAAPLVSPEDYDNVVADLSFTGTAGEMQQFTVLTLDDVVLEASETFTVSLDADNPLVTDTDTATGTIDDNDSAAVTVEDVTELEGTGLLFTVTLNTAVQGGTNVSVTLADVTATGGAAPLVSPEDYDNVVADLSFTGTAGETQQFTVATLDDVVPEASETFTVSLDADNPLVTDTDTATGTIDDNDAAAVTVEDVTELEGTGLLFTVTLDNAVQGGTNVSVTLADVTATGGAAPLVSPEDYDNVVANLSFAGTAGETRQFTVATLDDAVLEASETFTVSLDADNPLVTDTDTATGTIDDNDSAAVTVEDVTELEGTGLLFTVTLDNAVQGGTNVSVTLADVTATGGAAPLVSPEDYDNVVANLSFAGTAGETRQFTVATLDDAVLEASETFTVSLDADNPLVTDTDTAIGTIDDNDSAAVTVEDVTELEGTGLLFTVTLDNAVQGGTNVSVTLADVTATGGAAPLVSPEDYDNVVANLSFAGTAGEMQQFTVATLADGLVEGSQTFTVNLSSTDPLLDDSDTALGTIDDNVVAGGIKLETDVVTGVDNVNWTTVTLGQSYSSMVVVLSPNYDSGSVPLVPRVRNALGNSFEVRMDRTDGSTAAVPAIDVHYLVVEEGVYTVAEHGVKMEAVKFTSTVTDFKGSWVGEVQSYTNSYTDPVVVGQVMTTDPGSDFSVFWARGSSRTAPPSSTELWVGKHVGSDTNQIRANETIGYLVIEAGSGSIDGRNFVAARGADSVQGVDDAPPHSYSLTGLASASTAIVSQAAMDGGDGGWAVLYGTNPVNTTNLNLAVDEDQAADTERSHTTEQIAYLVFEDTLTAPMVTVEDVTEVEGVGLLFTVTLDTAVVGGTNVSVTLADVTATGGAAPLVSPEDYDNVVADLSFTGTAGETQQFTVATLDDVVLEASETFTVSLDADNPLVTDTDTATGTIDDNDSAAVTVEDVTELEGTGLLFTVTLNTAVQGGTNVSVTLADVTATGGAAPLVSPEDYDNVVADLSFTGTAGETQQFTVATLDDVVPEASETFTVSLDADNPLVTDTDTATGTIDDNDAAAVTVEDVTELEGTGLLFTVTLNTAVVGGTNVSVTLADVTATGGAAPLVSPEDYDNVVADLSFTGTAGETRQFTVATLDDVVPEASETFTVSLDADNPLVTDTDTATGTIDDNDAAAVTVEDVTELEGTGLLFTVTLNTAVVGGTNVSVTLADVTATGGAAPLVSPEDYDNVVADLSFTGTAGETRQFTVATLDDAVLEASETFTVSLDADNPLVTDTDTAIGTIDDNDSAAVTVEDVTEIEGTGFLFTVTLDNAVQGGTNVSVTLADVTGTGGAAPLVSPEDYDNVVADLNFAGTAGEMQQFTVLTLDDVVLEASETFTVSLDADNPLVTDTDTATGTIDDNDSAAVTVEDVTELEGTGLLFTVTLNTAVQGGTNVSVTLADVTATGGAAPLVSPEDYDNVVADLSFTGTAGETQQFTVATLDDVVPEASETFTVSLDADNPLVTDTDTATGTIDDNDAAAVTVEDVTELEGTGLLFTVTLDNAVQGGTNVSVTLADVTATGGAAPLLSPEDYDNVVANLSFAGTAGETRQFTVATLDDAVLEASETFTVSLDADNPLVTDTDTATGTIDDNDSAAVTVEDVTELEGTGLLFTVTLDNAVQGGTNVSVTLADVTATGGAAPFVSPEDYDNVVANLSFAGTAGETRQFTVATLDDAVLEASETFTVSLDADNPLVTDTDTAIGTIDDNDSAAVTVEDVTELEGTGLLFTVTLDNAVQGGTNVSVTLADVTATGGAAPLVSPEDYDNVVANLSFAGTAGEMQQFTVATLADGLVEGSQTFTVNLSSTDPLLDDSDTALGTIDDNVVAGGIKLETDVVTGVDNVNWTTVTLGQSYSSMVVVLSPNYDSGSVPLVPRVRNALGNSFEVRMDRTDGSTAAVPAIDVHYLVVEEGVYTVAEHGVKMEAVKFTSTVTDFKGSWVGEVQSYTNSYTDPVVVGQVMTTDPGSDFSVFWARGSSRTAPPSSTELWVGKHVGSDTNQIRANETIGYLVIEAGSGSIDGRNFVAARGADSVQGVDDAPPHSYSLTGLASASTAIVSQAAMDGGDGGWAVLYGTNPVNTTNLNLAVDEDQAADTERSHTTEQIAYLVFEEVGAAAASLPQGFSARSAEPAAEDLVAAPAALETTDDTTSLQSMSVQSWTTVVSARQPAVWRSAAAPVARESLLDRMFADGDILRPWWESSVDELLAELGRDLSDDVNELSVWKSSVWK